MRNTHLFSSWGVMVMLLCGLTLTSIDARGASQDGIIFITHREMPFAEVVKSLAQQSGLRLVMTSDVDAVIGRLNYSTYTLPEKILEDITMTVGQDFWRDGDTYFIGKRPTATKPPVIDPPSAVVTTAPVAAQRSETTASQANFSVGVTPASAVYSAASASNKTALVRTVELQHTSAKEIGWLLGASNCARPSAQRMPVLRNKIKTVLTPSRSQLYLNETGDTYSSPALSSPWNNQSTTGSVSRRSSATDAYQFGGINPGAGGFNPGTGGFNPGVGGINPAYRPGTGQNQQGGVATTPNNADDTTSTQERSGLGGDLASFLPDGIEDIVALVGLNALLVRATTEEALDQLELLIKMLDKPVKQVIVEAMIVKMEVVDAMAIGVSWEWAGMPVSVISNNPMGTGPNFSVRYVKGNVKAALDTLITTSKAKVVNAPRVIVQNGGTASISMTESIPFIMISQSQDVFGRTIETPEVDMQEFTQGLTVNQVTIHPDGYVTLDITPELEAPGAGVGIPGGSGSGTVSGSSSTTVETLVRVKNGETIMMGGFVSRQESQGGTRTPLLSNLPIVGPLLFRNNSKSWNNAETLIFVTPTIMEEDSTNFQGMSTLPPIW